MIKNEDILFVKTLINNPKYKDCLSDVYEDLKKHLNSIII